MVELRDEGMLVIPEAFVDFQERHVREMTSLLMVKSCEIETVGNDMLGVMLSVSRRC